MPIQIHSSLKKRLIELLCAELAKTSVYCDSFVYWDVYWDGISHLSPMQSSLPNKGQLADELRAYVGETSIGPFLQGELQKHFVGPGFRENAETRPITSYPGYEDPTELAKTLIEKFCSLPWQYQVCVRVPDGLVGFLKDHLGGYALSDRHRLVMGSQLEDPLLEFRNDSFGLMARSLSTGHFGRDGWDEEAAYLQVDVAGYFRNHLTEPVMAARDDVFSFLGLGLAFGLFSEETLGQSRARNGSPVRSQMIIYRKSTEDWGGTNLVSLDEHQQDAIAKLSVLPTSDADVADSLRRIGSILRSEEGKNLKLSARWLFDSHCGRDELLSYVQATVAIEILLGDEDADPDLGLTALMANRCAYLVANTSSARNHILKTFRDIYKVRSKIVHRGKSRLDSGEVQLFNYLKALVRCVIDREQQLLERTELSKAKARSRV